MEYFGILHIFEKLLRKSNEKFSIFGFIAGLTYVLTESFTIYGGNLASTLAGQFSFTYSIAFANLAIAVITKSSNKNKHVISAIFLGCSLLSHLIPFIIYGAIYLFFWVKTKNTKMKNADGKMKPQVKTVMTTSKMRATSWVHVNMG